MHDVVCSVCGSLCDDIEVTLSDDKKTILSVKNACAIGSEKFNMQRTEVRVTRPRLRQPDGSYKEISYEEAIDWTARMLVASRKTLMYGWINTSCQAMSAGHAIAEKVGGVVDNGATVCHGPSLIAIEDVGITTCTLGEVKNRADCVIFWGCNPAHVHPRHMSRYSIFPKGFFTKDGAKGRKIFCIDCRYTDTARCSDLFLRIEQGFDYEFIGALRTALRGETLPKMVAGVESEKIYGMAEDLKRAKFGVIFLGMGLSQSIGRNHNIDMAIGLTYDLNRFTKFAVMPMRVSGNVTGSGEVLGWQYGFPFAVDLSRGDQARHQTGETTAIDLLIRNEVEACLFVAADPAATFPIQATISASRKPTVTIDPHINCTTELSDLHIPVAVDGVETCGCAYRMDTIPLEMRKVVEPPEGVPTDLELLKRIEKRVDELMAEK